MPTYDQLYGSNNPYKPIKKYPEEYLDKQIEYPHKDDKDQLKVNDPAKVDKDKIDLNISNRRDKNSNDLSFGRITNSKKDNSI